MRVCPYKAPCGCLDLAKIQVWDFVGLRFFLQRGCTKEFSNGGIFFAIFYN